MSIGATLLDAFKEQDYSKYEGMGGFLVLKLGKNGAVPLTITGKWRFSSFMYSNPLAES